MSRIKDNLEIILNLKDLIKRIKDLESRAEIEGRIGIAKQTTPLGNSTSTGGDNTGGGRNGPSGGGDTRAGGDTSRSAKDALDDLKVGDVLDRLTDLYDCDSGDPLTLNPSGKETRDVGGGSGDHWILGEAWQVSAGTPKFATANSALADWFDTSFGGGTHEAPVGSGNYYQIFDYVNQRENGLYFGQFKQTVSNNVPLPESEQHPFDIGVSHIPCTIGVDSFCPSSDPGPYVPPGGDTPEDTPTELVWKNGRWQPTTGQTDVPTKYKDGLQSTMEFCFDDGEDVRHGRIEPASDGGTLLYETDDDGNILKDALHLDENGRLTYMVNKSEIDRYKAK